MATEPFIAEIKMFGGNFAPRGFAFCNGQLLSIAQNTALFSILGTTFGGNGTTNFGLPNLLGRVPVHAGNGTPGPGLPAVQLGESAGSPTTSIGLNNLPAHAHPITAASAAVPAFSGAGNVDNPVGAVPAGSSTAENYVAANTAGLGALAPAPVTGNTGPAGSNQPVGNMQPYLGVNFIIALQGIFPSRN